MIVFFLVIILSLLADQGVKYLVRSLMTLGESVPVIEGIFHITYIENPGAAFGMLANKTIFFVIFTVIIIGIMVYLFLKQQNKKSLYSISIAFVISGALGNLIDRLFKGTVTDMFDFRIWPVFNIADMLIVVGLGYIAYRLIIRGEEL